MHDCIKRFIKRGIEMNTDANKTCAHAYYEAMKAKDVAEMKRYLHPNVELTSPLAHLIGKDAVIDAASKLFPNLRDLHIRATFGSNAQAMIVLDMELLHIGFLYSASLLTINNNLITRIELFFDSKPFQKL